MNSYFCDCVDGFSGTNCETGKLPAPASRRASFGQRLAAPQRSQPRLTCAPLFSNFSADVNECASDPCTNGGTCVDQVNGFTCSCVPGFTGDVCQTSELSVMWGRGGGGELHAAHAVMCAPSEASERSRLMHAVHPCALFDRTPSILLQTSTSAAAAPVPTGGSAWTRSTATPACVRRASLA